MSREVLVRRAGQLLRLRDEAGPRRGAAMGELDIVAGGAVLVRDGTIVAAGPAPEVERQASKAAEEIDARNRVVAPGFVDSHTHLVFGRPRLDDYAKRIEGASYSQIARAGGGIAFSVRVVREMPATKLAAVARGFLNRMAACGTTTVEAKTGYGLDRETELKTLDVLERLNRRPLDIVATYLGAHICPPGGDPDAYIDDVCLPVLAAARGRARFADVYCDIGAFTVEQTRRYLSAARAAGFHLKIHAEQFAETGAAALAVQMGAVSADHLEQAGEDDVGLLARSETIATLLPGSVFYLGLTRYAPARALIEAGAAVALATDFNPGSSPVYNMQMVMSLACSQMRMSPAEAFVAATINGAYAAGAGDRAGSLDPGKQADLVVFDATDYREIPYYFGANSAVLTLKRGVPVGQNDR